MSKHLLAVLPNLLNVIVEECLAHESCPLELRNVTLLENSVFADILQLVKLNGVIPG